MVLIVAAALVAIALVMQFALVRSFSTLEERQVGEQATVLTGLLANQAQRLTDFGATNSVWDDLYQEIASSDDSGLARDLPAGEQQRIYGFDGLIGIGPDGRRRVGGLIADGAYRAPTGSLGDATLLRTTVPRSQPPGAARCGLLDSAADFYLYCAFAVWRSDGSGPPAGGLIVLYRLDQPTVAALGRPARLELRLQAADGSRAGAGTPVPSPVAPTRVSTAVQADRTLVRATMTTLTGASLAITIKQDRPVHRLAVQTTKALLGLLVAIAAVVLLALLWWTDRVVRISLRPLRRTTEAIIASGDLSLRVEPAGPGDIAALGHTVNRMLDTIQQTTARAGLAQEAAWRADLLSRVSQSLLTARDARLAICQAAVELAAADGSYLLEADGTGLLVTTAVSGPDFPPLTVRSDEDSLTAMVFRSGRFRFVHDLAREATPAAHLLRETGQVASAAWQPVFAGGEQPVGLISLVWRRPPELLPAHVPILLEALANEASHAIDRADLLARLAEAADRDSLTGLPNRRRWDELFGAELARARRTGRPLTVALIDLDHFKEYNDSHGHLAGDTLLSEFAGRAAECLRDTDILARWGGEEFALALPDCDLEEARPVLERIRTAVPRGQTCTIGVAEWVAGASAEQTFQAADAALYEGKRHGRNTVRVS